MTPVNHNRSPKVLKKNKEKVAQKLLLSKILEVKNREKQIIIHLSFSNVETQHVTQN